MNISKRIITSLFLISNAIFLLNCSPQKFSAVSPQEKASALDSHGGLDNSDDWMNREEDHSNNFDSGHSHNQQNNDNNGNSHQNGFSLTTTGPTAQTTDDSTSGDTTLNVTRWCRGADRGGSLRTSKSITIELYNAKTDKLICSVSGASALDDIIDTGKVTFKKCDLTGIKKIEVKAYNEKRETLEKDEDLSKLTLDLIFDKEVNKKKLHEKCDQYMSSPLVVDMRDFDELSQPFTLTSPINGEYFDILGANSNPSPYTKKLISKIEDPRVMPIVLFDSSIEFGIDQLFGDNTLGPDGMFADNGFAALAKYDGLNLRTNKIGNADGVIDRNDEVYQLLNLWFDKNMDNKVQKNELISLKTAGITLIDLDYDRDHYSRDQHGNEIKFKSVVKTRSGKLRPVFDVWYLVDERIQ